MLAIEILDRLDYSWHYALKEAGFDTIAMEFRTYKEIGVIRRESADKIALQIFLAMLFSEE